MSRISAHPHPKEECFNLRVDSKLKTAFQQATATEDISAAQVMRAYVERKKQKTLLQRCAVKRLFSLPLPMILTPMRQASCVNLNMTSNISLKNGNKARRSGHNYHIRRLRQTKIRFSRSGRPLCRLSVPHGVAFDHKLI